MWERVQHAVSTAQQAYVALRQTVTWTSLCTCTVTVGAAWITYVWLIRPFRSPLRKIPGLPFNPIYGNVPTILVGEGMESSLKMIAEFGKIVRYYFFFGTERVLVADADMFKHIFVTNSRNYIKPRTRVVLLQKVLGDGLVLQEGATHAAHKRLMSPAFNQSSIRRMVKTFVTYTNQLSDIWTETIENRPRTEDWGVLKVHTDLTRLTLDIIGQAAFGHDFNCLHEPDMEVTSAFNRLLSGTGLNWRMAIPFYYSMNIFPAVRRFNRDVHTMKSTIRNIIQLKRHKLSEGPVDGRASDTREVVLDTIMKARDDLTGEGLTDQELEDEVMTLMAAGHETTSVALAWVLLVLAQNQDIQQKVRDEIQHTIGDSNVTAEHVDKLHYVGCVVKETLRLYPPITMTLRQLVNDDQLGAYFIPKGTILLLQLGAMMRLPEYWDDPLSFKPERFMEGDGNKTLYTFLPFLIGNRMCLGYKFALVEMKSILAVLVRNFQFDTIPNLTFKRKPLLTMRPDPPLRLRVSLINKSSTP